MIQNANGFSVKWRSYKLSREWCKVFHHRVREDLADGCDPDNVTAERHVLPHKITNSPSYVFAALLRVIYTFCLIPDH